MQKKQEKKEKQPKEQRYRNFWTVFYEDSAPDDWQQIISDWHVPVFVSHHDQDISANGEPKKPHYHVMIMFDGVKSNKQVCDYFNSINGVYPDPEVYPDKFRKECVIGNIRTCARYLCHLDDYNKAQYLPQNVICFGGSDYMDICTLSKDKYYAIQEMMSYCRANEVTCFADLLEFSAASHFDWFRCLCDNSAIIMREYLKSLHWSIKDTDIQILGENVNKDID